MSQQEGLPTAAELAEVYGEYELDELADLAADVDAHEARALLSDARRLRRRARLMAALNLPVVREERARQYELNLAAAVELHNTRAAMRQAVDALPAAVHYYDPATAPTCGDAGQSAGPSE
jgi:hypothetical protein